MIEAEQYFSAESCTARATCFSNLTHALSGAANDFGADMVDKAVEAITGAAKTGQIGDGKIFVQELDRVIRIRTGEEGDEAL